MIRNASRRALVERMLHPLRRKCAGEKIRINTAEMVAQELLLLLGLSLLLREEKTVEVVVERGFLL